MIEVAGCVDHSTKPGKVKILAIFEGTQVKLKRMLAAVGWSLFAVLMPVEALKKLNLNRKNYKE